MDMLGYIARQLKIHINLILYPPQTTGQVYYFYWSVGDFNSFEPSLDDVDQIANNWVLIGPVVFQSIVDKEGKKERKNINMYGLNIIIVENLETQPPIK